MSYPLNRSTINKITLILFLLTIIIPLIIFNDTLDDFVPKHIAIVEETSEVGRLIERNNEIIQVPGFYAFGAIIKLISGLPSESLINFPVQLIPYIILIFTLLYLISNNFIVAGIITLITLCSGSTGTQEIFFWPHGIGYILFFTLLVLIILLLKQFQHSKSLILLAAIIGSTLVFISYNLIAMTLIFISIIIAILLFLYAISNNDLNMKNNYFLPILKKFSILLIFLCIIEFGLSKFIYGTFIPTLQTVQELDFSGFDKFSIAYINPEMSTSPLYNLMIHYPPIISIISGIKYSLLVITLVIFSIYIIKSILKNKTLGLEYLFLTAFFLTFGCYMIPRYFIGGIVITLLWLPGIFCIALFSQMSKNYKIWAFFIIFILIICIPAYYYSLDQLGYIDRNEYQFEYKASVNWFLRANDGRIAVSDELTKDFFIFYSIVTYYENKISGFNHERILRQYKILPREDVLAIVKLSDSSFNTKYFILNNRLTQMSLQNWIIIKSWKYSTSIINSNNKINKIYSSDLLSFYSS